MTLTASSHDALRCPRVAALKAPALIRVDDGMRVHGLARPHIGTIAHEPGRAGPIGTRRGRGGGFRLPRPAADLVIGDVVRLSEGSLDLGACFNPASDTCPPAGVCKLSRALQEATRAFMAVLDDLTVAAVATRRDRLHARLAPVGAAR